MNFNFLDHRLVRQTLTILFLPGALTCIFPLPYPVFLWWSQHAVLVALGYLLVGLCFLFINKTRLMFVCFGCSAAISFFKNETGNHWPPAKTSGQTLLPRNMPYSQKVPDTVGDYFIPSNDL